MPSKIDVHSRVSRTNRACTFRTSEQKGTGNVVRSNLLVEALSPSARRQLLASARIVDLPNRSTLFEAGEAPVYAYLLTGGVASLVIGVADGSSAEIGMVGSEGVIGSTSLLGPHMPNARCFMQVTGSGWRVPLTDLRRMFQENEEIRSRTMESAQLQMLALSQIAACNKLHQAEERLARWLLTAADRAGTDTIDLTQEALAQMLGTRRTTVALVAGAMQRSGLIRYRRGSVEVKDRAALIQKACDCYSITAKLLENAYR